MHETPEALEERIAGLRQDVRRAAAGGDRPRARALRAELKELEAAWERSVLGDGEARDARDRRPDGPMVPLREQVHHALTLLGAPAAPKLVLRVHEAFLPGEIVAARLTSLRRDEERSFRAAPYARPYYLCAALTADLLAPARGLLAVSTWPLRRRVVGPLSARTDFLTAAIRIAEHTLRVPDGDAARRLLWRFAASIPGAGTGTGPRPEQIIEAARAELEVHAEADREQRLRAADRALARLDDAGRLFGARPRDVPAVSRPATRPETTCP
ncbi:hypothetical protein ACRYCC_39635 [Actinomadura scrupuli]|uniref:hypothetical protein n=1 Tax=Actinomadura scrupuli TaxID=559629 RepID=UPI003D96D9CE